MDALTGLLDGPRARGAFTLRVTMRAPWGLRVAAGSALTVLAPVRGDLWVMPDGGAPLCLAPGDLGLTRGPEHYTVADDPATRPEVTILPGQDCRDARGASVKAAMSHGIRRWGNDPEGGTLFLVGAYEGGSVVTPRLARVLPPVARIPAEGSATPLVALMEAEAGRDEPGQAAVLDRLLDLLTTAALKAWLAGRKAEDAPALAAGGDALVERALALMHAAPARCWTLAALAREAGASRAALARRFERAVGEPPMTWLAGWRMALAADLLAEPDATLARVAERVGYANAFAFSAAFKRVRGLSPKAHRARMAGGTVPPSPPRPDAPVRGGS